MVNIRNKKGFTLIEIAALFTIIGVIVMVTVNFMNSGTKTDKAKEQLVENERLINEFVGLINNGNTVEEARQSIADNYIDIWGNAYDLKAAPIVTDLCTTLESSTLYKIYNISNKYGCWDSSKLTSDDIIFMLTSTGPNAISGIGDCFSTGGSTGASFITNADTENGLDDLTSFITLSDIRSRLNCPAPEPLEITTASDIVVYTTADLSVADSQKVVITANGGIKSLVSRKWSISDVKPLSGTATTINDCQTTSPFMIENTPIKCNGSTITVTASSTDYVTLQYKAKTGATMPQGLEFTLKIQEQDEIVTKPFRLSFIEAP